MTTPRTHSIKSQDGTSVIEVLIALAMVSIIIVSIGNVLSSVHARDLSTELREQALGYAKESLEIVENMQSSSLFPDNVTGNPLHLEAAGTTWTFAAGPEDLTATPPFERREIRVENMDRDASGNLVDLGLGQPDVSTKKITVTLFWSEKEKAKELSLSTVLTDR